MGAPLSKLATEVARRWIKAEDRLAKKGKPRAALTVENMREFADGMFDDLDTFQLDTVADLAVSKVANFRIGESAR